MLVFRHWGTR